jgi:hypothetical protein
LADFVPGFLYVSDPSPTPYQDGGGLDRIWEVNPQTGDRRVFARIPAEYTGGVTGLTFTPDGGYLRASALFANKILELDGDGNVGVALDASDGLHGPTGLNNLAYDAAGNFYVATIGPPQILRFPAGGGPASVFADPGDGLSDSASISIAPTGELYAAVVSSPRTIRLSPDGESELFTDIYGMSVTVDSRNDVYLAGVAGLYRFANGNSAVPELLTSWDFEPSFGSIAISPVGGHLVFANLGRLRVVKLDDGRMESLPGLPGGSAGAGSVFYVPEPSVAVLTVIASLTNPAALRRRHRLRLTHRRSGRRKCIAA